MDKSGGLIQDSGDEARVLYNGGMAAKAILGVRGMHDILPDAIASWQRVEAAAAQLFFAYGYRQIRTPLVERLALFERQLGESTDVVQKEMYAFTDSLNDEKLALRPEATVSTIRALLAAGAHRAGVSRVWYSGAMFRHERPQKGRYRQFHQIGGEATGSDDPLVEAEQIILLARFWDALGIASQLKLTLNNLGDAVARARHREQLREYFYDCKCDWDAQAQLRLEKNPLRLLDDKNPEVQELAAAAPPLADFLDAQARDHVAQVKTYLDAHNIAYEDNPRLVRGLDYYNRTVFEWVLADGGGSQNAVCGGGRYDQLAETISAHAMAGCGFALGVERVLQLVEAADTMPKPPAADVYLAVLDASCHAYALAIAEDCRTHGIAVVQHLGTPQLGRQIKKAEALGVPRVVVVGTAEMQADCVKIKQIGGRGMDDGSSQQSVPRVQLIATLRAQLAAS